ncbi:MAG TPA: DUF2784 domain-containing protein [Phenylobacterium sp.]|uniref:DUF2784 domain-containing protein n=1 Tax=Phenylobacterium sp. TaxID=1871053 RepID=UPI002C127C2B|nr:DUF2784 domain-containing protein [Phenylobacterium sp.]HSV04178.1 DUF2784 domain-containing protein [Phenylobacterium sp.]
MSAASWGELVLAAHLVVIAFNLFGLVAIPAGAALGWAWVRIPWWRLLHLASLAVVALQAVLGRACFLTLWQDALTGAGRAEPPLIMRWVNSVIYWPLPMWVFTAAYVAIFAYTAALWRWVPPRRRARAG